MKNCLKIYLILCILISCKKGELTVTSFQKISSEFIDLDSDTMRFYVYQLNSADTIDIEIWAKTLDTCYSSNSRSINYSVSHSKASTYNETRSYSLTPSTIKTSSRPSGDYLHMHKVIQNRDSTLNYHRESSGIYTRYFLHNLVKIKTSNYEGAALRTYLTYEVQHNDSTLVKTVIDEYYAIGYGLIKIIKSDAVFNSGVLQHTTYWNKIRVL